MKIGEVARRSGLGIETIRFYERLNLIDVPPRRSSGYRAYPPDAVARLQFIKHAKALGFSLEEIRELLSLRVDPMAKCKAVQERARAKLADIEHKIDALQRMRDALGRIAAACVGNGPVSECPILEALETGQPNEPKD